MENSNPTLNIALIEVTTDPLASADSAISLLGKALLPKATELARAGKYREAEVLLQHLIQEGGALPAIYDLLARIRAQQGRFLEAQAEWAEAIRLSSSREFYRAALKRIERLQTSPAWFRWFNPSLLGVSLLLVVTSIIAVIHFSLTGLKIPTIKQLNPKPPRQAPVIERPLKIAIKIPGAQVTEGTDQVIITFESGLFSNLTELRPEAKASLDLLAEQLRPYAGKVLVNAEGRTDDLPITKSLTYRDNVSLGLHRAVTVIEYLRLKGRLPSGTLKASSMGELQSLYPNDTFSNRLRNRTVVLRITALKDSKLSAHP